MKPSARWPVVAAVVVCLGAFLPGAASGQNITGLGVQPSPACAGDMVTVRVNGPSGNSCTDVRLRIDDGGGNVLTSPPQSGDLPLDFTTTVNAAGTYTLTLQPPPPDCAVNIPGGQTVFQVLAPPCIVAGVDEDDSLTEVQGRVVAQADEFAITTGVTITKGFGGKLRPGNEASFFLGGYDFPTSDAGGDVFLLLDGTFWVQLEEVQWDSTGSAVAVRVPENICGVGDQQAVVRIVTSEGLISNDWPVEFQAKRVTRTLTQDEIEVISCGTGADIDRCNDVVDVGVIEYFCGFNENASFSGCHYNAAGVADFGSDKYRVDLVNGWTINTILYVRDIGKPNMITNLGVGESSHEIEVIWGTLMLETEMYSGFVSIIGPCGIPYN